MAKYINLQQLAQLHDLCFQKSQVLKALIVGLIVQGKVELWIGRLSFAHPRTFLSDHTGSCCRLDHSFAHLVYNWYQWAKSVTASRAAVWSVADVNVEVSGFGTRFATPQILDS